MVRRSCMVLDIFNSRSPGFVSGWADLLPPGTTDATPAVFVALIMFAVPASDDGEALLTWKIVQVIEFYCTIHNVYVYKYNVLVYI